MLNVIYKNKRTSRPAKKYNISNLLANRKKEFLRLTSLLVD